MEKRDFEESFEEQEVISGVERFEEMLRKRAEYYFDSCLIEEIVGYYLSQNNSSRALQAAEYGLSQHPELPVLLLAKADVLITLHPPRLDEALAILDKLEEAGVYNAEMFLYKGDIFFLKGMYEQAITAYRNALPLADDPDAKKDLYLNISFASQCAQNHERSLHYILECLKNFPEDEEVLSELWVCLEHLGRYEEAERRYNAVIERNPYSYTAWHYLGMAYKGMKDYDKALQAIDYALAIKEDLDYACEEYANILLETGRYKEAIEWFYKALDAGAPADNILRNVGECYEFLNEPARARAYYEKAGKYIPADEFKDDLWFRIGRTYYAEKKFGQAKKCFARAIKNYCDEPMYFSALGDTEKEISNLPAAVEAYSRAAVLDTGNPDHWVSLVTCLFDSGLATEAMETSERGLSLNPESPDLAYLHCGVLFMSGKNRDALLALEEAMDLNYDDHIKLFQYFPELEKHPEVLEAITGRT